MSITSRTRQRLFALWADAVQALVNGDHVRAVEIQAKADAILRGYGDAWVKARDHKIRLQGE